MQYPELNALHEELKSDNFVILGFPCNQFGLQEPGRNEEIPLGLKYVRPGTNFVPNFQLFEKKDVNGWKEQKFYTFLKNSCPPVGDTFGNPPFRLNWEPLKVNDIKWNFEKFLVGPDGHAVKRWHPRTSVAQVRRDVVSYIKLQQGTQRLLMLGLEQK
ncbi:hypothetical protein XELAEV_18020033mg [Xenopus laevis]|nr:hypothetical protein XELAEV_18020033mg [Xenopus laevis]